MTDKPRQGPTDRQFSGVQRGGAKDCCKARENLSTVWTSPTTATTTCRVCGCNHYYMQADPVRVFG